MNKNNKLHWVVIACIASMVQGCAIPAIIKKKVDAPLPASYQNRETQESQNVAEQNWRAFFEDPELAQLIDTAIENNKEIKILMQRISMAQNEVLARKGEYKPFVRFGAGVEVEKAAKYTRNGAVEDHIEIVEEKSNPEYLGNYQFGVNASWELDVWKKLRNATQVAVLEYMASVEGKNFLVTNLVAEVANSYYELMALDNQMMNLEQNIKTQENALEVVKELQKFGKSTSLAVKRFEAEVQKNQSQRYVLKQQVTEIENRINFLLGRTPQPITRNAQGFMAIQPKVLQTGIPSQLLTNRPDIRKAELELQAADLNIDVAKANFYPSFAIKAGVGFQAFNPKYLLRTPESLAISLAGDIMAPLVNKNAIIAEYKNASAGQIQAAYEYEQTIIRAYDEVSTHIASLDNLDKNYQLKNSQVNALNESIDVANQLFKYARADYLEVLLTQRESLEAKMELIETKQKQMSAMVSLYRSLGGGWH